MNTYPAGRYRMDGVPGSQVGRRIAQGANRPANVGAQLAPGRVSSRITWLLPVHATSPRCSPLSIAFKEGVDVNQGSPRDP